MNTFMAIMSQLFWGVTVGALSSTFSLIAKGAAMAGGVGGAGWWSLRRRRRRREQQRREVEPPPPSSAAEGDHPSG